MLLADAWVYPTSHRRRRLDAPITWTYVSNEPPTRETWHCFPHGHSSFVTICILKPIQTHSNGNTLTFTQSSFREQKSKYHTDVFNVLPLSFYRQWYSAGLRTGWSVARVPAGAGNFSLHHRVQTGSGAHPSSYAIGSKGSFPVDKAAGKWSWPFTSI
jgi:hypothetical protein